jgi:hypothetical protein
MCTNVASGGGAGNAVALSEGDVADAEARGGDAGDGGMGICFGTCTDIANGRNGGFAFAGSEATESADSRALGGDGGDGGVALCAPSCDFGSDGAKGGDATAIAIATSLSDPVHIGAVAESGHSGSGGLAVCTVSCLYSALGGAGNTALAAGTVSSPDFEVELFSFAYGSGEPGLCIGAVAGCIPEPQ